MTECVRVIDLVEAVVDSVPLLNTLDRSCAILSETRREIMGLKSGPKIKLDVTEVSSQFGQYLACDIHATFERRQTPTTDKQNRRCWLYYCLA